MRLLVLRLLPVMWPRLSASRPSGRVKRARRAVLLIPLGFVFVLAVAWTGAESTTPEITDTDYHARLKIIRNVTAEYPECPLGIVMGSSRMVWAFRPEQLPEPAAGEVSWANAAHIGAGPTINRILLHRYLRDGVRPSVAVIEIMPTFFTKENNRFVSGHFAASDWPLARKYADQPFNYDYYFLRHRVTRAPDIARVVDPYEGSVQLLPRGGHPTIDLEVTSFDRERRTAAAFKNNAEYLRRLRARPAADRAFRDTLREATDNGIRVVLLRSPEGPTFRAWYDPETLARFDAYIAEVAAEFHIPILDARLWLEEEDFFDSHHVLKRGADKFTARFAKELPALLTTSR